MQGCPEESSANEENEEETKEVAPRSMNEAFRNAKVKWLGLLARKGRKESGENSMKRYSLAKKVMKDFRKFFRLLFLARFPRSQRSSPTKILRCVRTLCTESRLSTIPEESTLFEIAKFLRPKVQVGGAMAGQRRDSDSRLQLYERMNTNNL